MSSKANAEARQALLPALDADPVDASALPGALNVSVESPSSTRSGGSSSRISSPSRRAYIPKRADPLYSKLKYFQTLRDQAVGASGVAVLSSSPAGSDFLAPPSHILPSNLFVIGMRKLKAGETPKQSRLQTITSIINTMMGTAVVALPLGFAESGILLGLFIVALIGCIACFTCLLVVKYGHGGDEFSEMVRAYLGRRAQIGAWAISVAVVAGAAIVYHILIQESIFQLAQTVMTAAGASNTSWWHPVYAAMPPFALLPLANKQDLTILVKFNSLGFLFLWFTICFVLYHGFHGLATGATALAPSLPPAAPAWNASGALNVVWAARSSFGSLAGMMLLSFFLHNCIQPIVKYANPTTRRKDIVIGYSITGFLYALVGAVGTFGFADVSCKQAVAAAGAAIDGWVKAALASWTGSGAAAAAAAAATAVTSAVEAAPRALADAASTAVVAAASSSSSSSCELKSNILTAFGTTLSQGNDIYAFATRMSLLLQLMTVYPLLLLIIRTQVFGLIYSNPWPGYTHVALLNALVMGVTFACAALDLQISSVLSYTGAIGGLIIVILIPICIDVTVRRKAGTASPAMYALHGAIVLVGIIIFILQFAPIG